MTGQASASNQVGESNGVAARSAPPIDTLRTASTRPEGVGQRIIVTLKAGGSIILSLFGIAALQAEQSANSIAQSDFSQVTPQGVSCYQGLGPVGCTNFNNPSLVQAFQYWHQQGVSAAQQAVTIGYVELTFFAAAVALAAAVIYDVAKMRRGREVQTSSS